MLRLRKRKAGKRVQPPPESPEGVYQLLPRLPAEALEEVGLWGARMTPRCYKRPPFRTRSQPRPVSAIGGGR